MICRQHPAVEDALLAVVNCCAVSFDNKSAVYVAEAAEPLQVQTIWGLADFAVAPGRQSC
jgi:hypothetical protein